MQKLQDHPRVCGEKGTAPQAPGHPRGSPPRMRGKAGSHPRMIIVVRITPAYAGKSIVITKLC